MTHRALQLKGLVQEILEKHQECERAVRAARLHSKEAIALAWEIGGLLRRAKNRLPHGHFLKWREENLLELSQSTASRYLALANRIPSRQDLDRLTHGDQNLTDLYRNVGILPQQGAPREEDVETEANERPRTRPDGDSAEVNWKRYLSSVNRLQIRTRKVLEERPISRWSEEERARFLAAFEALKSVAEELRSEDGQALSEQGQETKDEERSREAA